MGPTVHAIRNRGAAAVIGLTFGATFLGTMVLALLLTPVLAQSGSGPDALESYDANDDGTIDEQEFLQAVADHVYGLIDVAPASVSRRLNSPRPGRNRRFLVCGARFR